MEKSRIYRKDHLRLGLGAEERMKWTGKGDSSQPLGGHQGEEAGRPTAQSLA